MNHHQPDYYSRLAPHHAEILRAARYDLDNGHHGYVAYEAIATLLNLPLGTVKSRLHRARKALAKLAAQ